MEIWELSYFTFYIYQVTPTVSEDKPTAYKKQGPCLSANPEVRPGTRMQSQARSAGRGRPEHSGTPNTQCWRVNVKHQPLLPLSGLSHHARTDVYQNTG